MRFIKIFIIILIPVFSLNLSAQIQPPKIGWKNLQENYGRFQDIKPIIRNEGNEPVYFDCSDNDYGSFVGYGYDGKFKLLNDVGGWVWNVMICGYLPPKLAKNVEKRERRKAELKKKGKYIPSGCRLDANQEYTIRISDEQWQYIMSGESSAYYSYSSGKYKFTLDYEWANAPNPATSESPVFNVNLSEKQSR